MGAGVAVLPTAPERVRNRDAHYPYRFDSYFYYLTGFREPEAVLVVIAGSEPKSILFCREKDPDKEIWDGYRYGPEAARTQFGFDEARAIGELDTDMPDLLADQPAVYCHLGADAGWDARVLGWLNVWRKIWWDNSVLRRSRVGRRALERHRRNAAVHYFRGEAAEAAATQPTPVQIDGDEFGEAVRMVCRVETGALLLALPAGHPIDRL